MYVHSGLRGPKQEIHLAGKQKGGKMSKSAKMKLIGIQWIPPVAILWMLEKGPEAETTIWEMFNFHPRAHCEVGVPTFRLDS